MIKTEHLEKIKDLPYFYNKGDPLWYKKVLSLDGKNVQALYELAREKENKGFYAEALNLYEKCYSYGLTSAIVDVNRLEGLNRPLIRRVLGTPPGYKKILSAILLTILALAALLAGIYIYNNYFHRIVENYYHLDFNCNIYYLNDPSSALGLEAATPGRARKLYVTFPYHSSPREMAEKIKDHAENDRQFNQPANYGIYFGPGFSVGPAPPPGSTYVGEALWAADRPPGINLYLRSDLHKIKPGDDTAGQSAKAGPGPDPVISGGSTPPSGDAFYGKKTSLPPGSGSGGAYAIYVDKSENKLYLYCEGVLVRSFPAALGRENKTPSGRFLITNKALHRRGSEEFNTYGSGWLGINIPAYGLHGTNNPGDVGGNITEGCIRLLNDDILCLIDTVPLQTPVVIH